MELKKLLTILVVSTVVFAAMSTVIEAQRGGHGGSGHHWSVDAGSNNNNVGDNNNAGNNAGYVDVYVSTDKQRYVLDEPIEITVTVRNLNDYSVFIYDDCALGTLLTYIIDGYIGQTHFVDENGNIINTGGGSCGAFSWHALQPGEAESKTLIRSAGSNEFGDYVPLPVGKHSVVGRVWTWEGALHVTPLLVIESRPITIRVTDSNNGGMG